MQINYPGSKSIGICDGLYEGFDVMDDDLNFENYEELFGAHDQSQFLEDGGIDSLFAKKDAAPADSFGQKEFVAEV